MCFKHTAICLFLVLVVPSLYAEEFHIDLSQNVNMGFMDAKKGDKKGGWTDQGPTNDLRAMKPGKRKFCGINFDVIDPDNNNGKSCVVLGFPKCNYFIKKTSIKKVGISCRYIYLLHAAAWMPAAGGKIGFVRIKYADGTHENIDVMANIDVGDWWYPTKLTNAAIAWQSKNKRKVPIGLYVSKLKIQKKSVESLDLETGNIAMWMVVGITGSDEDVKLRSLPSYLEPDPAYFEDLLPVRDNPDDPLQLIFDTDVGDIDDQLALALIHNMIRRRKCDLLGITITSLSIDKAHYCKTFNALYGSPDIPIGLLDGKWSSGKGARHVNGVLAMKNADGSSMFPVPDWSGPERAISLLRRLLAKAKDHSIVIAQVGHFTNLAQLLDSRGDEHSALSGKDLVERKVRLLSVMGGCFIFKDGKGILTKGAEWNVKCDIPAAQKLCDEWPTEIVFSGVEIGTKCRLPVVSVVNDYKNPMPNIMYETYIRWRGANHSRPTWDLTSVLFCVRPEKKRDYFSLTPFGRVLGTDKGQTRFVAEPSGKHRCFLMNREQQIRVTEAFVNLCSEIFY